MDIALLIITLVIVGLLPFCSIYFVVYFQHEDDKLTAWAPKIISVVGLTLAVFSLFLLPLDVANGQYGKLPIKAISITLFSLDILFCMLIIPFMILYYEGIPMSNEPTLAKSTVYHQIVYACKWIVPVIVILISLTIPLYIFFGEGKINQTILNANFIQGNTSLFANFCDSTSLNSLKCGRSFTQTTMRINLFVFMLAIIDLFGWLLLSVFGSIGAISMFWDSLREFKIRNSLLTKRELDGERERISRHAERLLIEHGKICQLKEGDKIAQKEAKERQRHFIKQVIQLEKEKDILQYRDKERQKYKWANLNKYFLFVCASTTFLIYILWVIQVIVYALPKSFSFHPPVTFLNAVLVKLGRVPLLSTLIYLLFSSFLILFVIKGLLKVSSVCSWFSAYPIRIGETTMNSLLFNIELILFCSISVLHMSLLSFFEYTAHTYVAFIFVKQIQSLVLFKYIYIGFLFVFLSLAPITLFLYTLASFVKARKRKQKRHNQNQNRTQNTPKTTTTDPIESKGFSIMAEDEVFTNATLKNQSNPQSNSLSNLQRSPFTLK